MYILMLIILQFSASEKIDTNFKHTVKILASDSMKGRSSLRPEIWNAAKYIESEFEEIGLEKDNGSYFQKFNRPEGVEIANVLGFISAIKPTQKSIIFVAHYDGLGVGTTDSLGDSIYNGAVDNAVGVAALIELARLYQEEGKRKINIVFLATGAEEGGSYGAETYLNNPLFSIDSIRFVLNIDGFSVHGEFENIYIFPRQEVTFHKTISNLAEMIYGLKDSTPEWADQMNTSFDSATFLKKGIPAATIWSGDKLKGMSLEESAVYQKKITGGRHHTVKDEFTDLLDFSGVFQHLILYQAIAAYYLDNDVVEQVLNKSIFE